MKIGVEKYCEGIPPAKVRRKSPSTTIVHVLAWKLHLKRWIVEEAHSCSHGRMEERLKEEGSPLSHSHGKMADETLRKSDKPVV